MSRQDRVFAGVAGLIGVVVAAQYVPELVGVVVWALLVLSFLMTR